MALTTFSRKQRATLAQQTKDKIRELMIGVSGHPTLLYEVVAGGPFQFRQVFLRAFRGFAVDGHIADSIFRFFCLQVTKRHPQAGDAPHVIAGTMLDHIEEKSAPTEAEIEQSWVHDVFSTEDGRREHYKDGAGMAGQDHKVNIH